jgi:hypothetical protein
MKNAIREELIILFGLCLDHTQKSWAEKKSCESYHTAIFTDIIVIKTHTIHVISACVLKCGHVDDMRLLSLAWSMAREGEERDGSHHAQGSRVNDGFCVLGMGYRFSVTKAQDAGTATVKNV